MVPPNTTVDIAKDTERNVPLLSFHTSQSGSANLNVPVDRPVQPTVTPPLVLNNNIATVHGTGAPGKLIYLYEVATKKLVGNATVDANGNFVINSSPLGPGTHEFTIRQADEKGAESAPVPAGNAVIVATSTLAPPGATTTNALPAGATTTKAATQQGGATTSGAIAGQSTTKAQSTTQVASQASSSTVVNNPGPSTATVQVTTAGGTTAGGTTTAMTTGATAGAVTTGASTTGAGTTTESLTQLTTSVTQSTTALETQSSTSETPHTTVEITTSTSETKTETSSVTQTVRSFGRITCSKAD